MNSPLRDPPMKLSIAAVGSRGDVQPYVALGRGLRHAGHQVQIIADSTYEEFVGRAGLGYAPLRADPHRALEEDVRQVGANPLRLMGWLIHQFRPLARQGFADVLAACADSDAVIYSSLAFAASHVAEARGIPALPAFPQPLTPTRSFPAMSAVNLPAWLPYRGLTNWWSFRLANWLFLALVAPTVNDCRREVLGLPPWGWRVWASLDVSEVPILYGYSRHVVPRPPDWHEGHHVTGYWFLDRAPDWQPPEALARFLEAGPPPVYIGFGSMVEPEIGNLTQLVVDALRLSGQRGILLGGWADLGSGDLPATVTKVDDVPHDWLFGHVAAVVHHGGAGTTAAGLRAGQPMVVVPYFADQPFWGYWVRRLGVGPAPIPRVQLTADRLAEAIKSATGNTVMRQRATDLGALLRAEDGVVNAVDVIERYLKLKRDHLKLG